MKVDPINAWAELIFLNDLRRLMMHPCRNHGDIPWMDATISMWIRGEKVWEDVAYTNRLRWSLQQADEDQRRGH